MSKLSDLRAQRDKAADEASALNDKYPANKRMSVEDAEKLDAKLSEVEAIDRQINVMMKIDGAYNPGGEDWREGKDESRIKVLRSEKDIRAHYANSPQTGSMSGAAPSIDDFLRGVAGMQCSPEIKAALSEGTDTAGGYSVPNRVMPEIMTALVPASSLMAAGAGIVPLSDGGKSFTTAAVDAIPNAAWRLEAGAVAESEPTFRAVVATPRSLAFMFKVSRELLADAANMRGALTTVIAQALAKEMDRAGLRGTGTNPEPRGILNTAGIQSITNGTNGASLTGYANFLSATQAIMQADAPMPTAAIMSPRSLVKLAGLLDTTNQPLMRPGMLENMNMIATSQIPNNLTVGSSTDCSEIYIGDFTRMAFVVREAISIQLLDQNFAMTGQIGFLAHARVDVVLSYPTAFSVVTGVRA